QRVTIGASGRVMVMNVADAEKAEAGNDNRVATLSNDKGVVVAAASANLPAGATLEAKDGSIRLSLPAHGESISFTLSIWGGAKENLGALSASLTKGEAVDLHILTKGGAGLWKQTVQTKATMGKDDKAYTVDTFEPPFKNPY